MNLTVVIDPADDHVSASTSVISREAQTDVTQCFHLHFKGDVPLARRPQNEKIVIKDGAVLPLESRSIIGGKNQEKKAEHKILHHPHFPHELEN